MVLHIVCSCRKRKPEECLGIITQKQRKVCRCL